MTTPGGVPNLPLGALTVETLGKQLQDLSAAEMRQRAGQRMPQIFHNSTGGNILNDLSPFGILTRIWAEINALIAASSPNDINGPEDIPPLITNFIEGLPVIGQLFDLLLALLGQYEGDDENLLAIQDLFAPVRALVEVFGQLVDGELTNLVGFFDGFNVYDPVGSGTRLLDQVLKYVVDRILTTLTGGGGGLNDLAEHIPVLSDLVRTLMGTTAGGHQAADLSALGSWARSLLNTGSPVPGQNIIGTISAAALGIIPIGNIGNTTPNLLTVSRFEDAANLDADDNWTWDDNVTHDGSAGSVKMTANGSVIQLTSEQDVPVSPGDKLNCSVYIKTDSLGGTGTPLLLQLVPFIGETQQNPVTVASSGAATSWTKLSGQYTVPNTGSSSTQITSLRVQLTATDFAMSGTVWWDDINLSKVGLLQQTLVDQLLDAWRNITGLSSTALTTLLNALGNPLAIANLVTTNHNTLNNTLKTSPGDVLGILGEGLNTALVDGVKTVGQFLGGLHDAFSGVVTGVVKTVTQLFGVAGYPLTRANLGITNAATASAANTATNKAIYDGYFGGGGSGAVAEAQSTIAAIKTKLTSGYTLETLTYNAGSGGTGTWTRPFTVDEAPKEFYVVAYGSGGGGGAGEAIRITANANVLGGLGGQPGGYAAVQIDATTLPSTVSYTIAAGALGRTSASRTATSGGETSFGSYLTTVSGLYNVTDVLGYYATPSSAPGGGGLGGTGCVTGGAVQGGSGATGGSSPLASGGTGGSGGGYSGGLTIGAGGTGETAPLTGTARAGGGGGGGGGGTMPLFDPTIFTLTYSTSKGYSSITPAGLGGNGGFPGGGGGGGGGCATLNASAQAPTPIPAGNGGNGAHGVIILLWK